MATSNTEDANTTPTADDEFIESDPRAARDPQRNVVVRPPGFSPSAVPQEFVSEIKAFMDEARPQFKRVAELERCIQDLQAEIAQLTITADKKPPLQPSVIERLMARFGLRDPSAVTEYLGREQYLIPLLVDASGVVRETFGAGQRCVLEILVEPDSGAATLYLFIRTGLAPESAAELLDQFDRQWWLDALPRARGNLTISLEFTADV